MFKEEGIQIFFKEDPLCVVVLTPLAQRAHTLPMASEMVFSDTTSSCDAGHHSVTFLHSPCAAGAAPLGVLITTGQSEEIYKEAFSLFKKEFPSAFNGKGYPHLFMTDNSLAEINSIQAVWPMTLILLCIFHVLQAVWRWLWEATHYIPANKRIEFFGKFKSILYASDKTSSEEMYEACLSNGLDFPEWVEYVKYYWKFKEKWCLCYRDYRVRGSHTNNYSEAAIRVMKDQVLSRVKAYNLISLIDFICTGLEEVYITRFTEFSNFRQRQPFLFFKKCLKKSSYLKKSDIYQLDEVLFCIKSQQDSSKFYMVNIEAGCCTCPAGEFGKFCKHECAVYHYFDICSKNFPAITPADRQLIYKIAVGEEKCPTIDFFEDFQTQKYSKKALTDNTNAETCSLLLGDLSEEQFLASEPCIIDSEQQNQEIFGLNNSVSPPEEINYVALTTQKLENKINQFKVPHSEYMNGILKKFCDKIDRVSSVGQLENLLLGLHKKRYKSGAKINVQPTSVARRRAGLTRGSKRQRCGRPPKGTAVVKKRKHNITENVQNNVKN